MNAYELMMKAEHQIEHGDICLGEYAQIIDLLKDVEPVVRCKDCKYGEPFMENKIRCSSTFDRQLMCPDDYCSYATRKEKE